MLLVLASAPSNYLFCPFIADTYFLKVPPNSSSSLLILPTVSLTEPTLASLSDSSFLTSSVSAFDFNYLIKLLTSKSLFTLLNFFSKLEAKDSNLLFNSSISFCSFFILSESPLRFSITIPISSLLIFYSKS